MTDRQLTRWQVAVPVLLELALLTGLVVLALAYWPRGRPLAHIMIEGVQAPAWGSVGDMLMTGPDAGEWARNALHVHHGRGEQVDPHRMPTWLGLTALAMHVTGSVATAGHLVNHLLHGAMVLVLYVLGRVGGGRGVGLMAAALGGFLPHVIADSRTFGIDILVATAIPASLLGGLLAARWWPLAPVGGALAGLASLSHFTTLPYVLPALVLVLIRGPRTWGRRALAVTGYGLGAWLTVWWVYQQVPIPTQTLLMDSLQEGIHPGQARQMQEQLNLGAALLQAGSLSSLNSAVATGLGGVLPTWLPWRVGVVAIWLGILGAGLGSREALQGKGAWRRLWNRCDLGLGVPLLLCLAPLPALIAVGAPTRYVDNFLGVVAVLMARGIGSPLVLGELGLKRLWKPWPLGTLALALGAGSLVHADRAGEDWKMPSLPDNEGILHARLAGLLSARLPPGSGVSSSARAALVMADMELCPQRACPLGSDERHFEACLQTLARECPGEAPIGWITTDWSQQDPYSLNRQAMSDWIAERWPLQGRVRADRRAHRLFLIPREDIVGISSSEEDR